VELGKFKVREKKGGRGATQPLSQLALLAFWVTLVIKTGKKKKKKTVKYSQGKGGGERCIKLFPVGIMGAFMSRGGVL